MKEIWKPVLNYSDYEVSNIGEVRSIDRYKTCTRRNGVSCTILYRGKLLKSQSKKGYRVVYLTDDNGTKEQAVHRLVAQAFIPNPDNLPQVNHKDGIKDNNVVDNLEWCDASYNCKHAVRIGLKDKALKKISIPVIDLTTGIIYKSCSEAERQLNLPSASVSEGIKKSDKFIKGHKFTRYEDGKEYKLVDSEASKDLKDEIWKPVAGYEQWYNISNKGRIECIRLSVPGWHHIMKIDVSKDFVSVELSNGVEQRTHSVGKLVFETFVRKLNKDEKVIHIDGDVTNNNLENLKAGTASDAYNIAVKTGKISHEKLVEYQKRGSKKRCKPVKDMLTGKIYGGMQEADKDLGFKKDTVSDLIRENKEKDGHYFIRIQKVEIGGVTYGR